MRGWLDGVGAKRNGGLGMLFGWFLSRGIYIRWTGSFEVAKGRGERDSAWGWSVRTNTRCGMRGGVGAGTRCRSTVRTGAWVGVG